MFNILLFIRKYSFVLIVCWMALYAVDLIDDLQFNYKTRSSTAVAWMLVSDFVRFFLVIGIWIAANVNSEKERNK